MALLDVLHLQILISRKIQYLNDVYYQRHFMIAAGDRTTAKSGILQTNLKTGVTAAIWKNVLEVVWNPTAIGIIRVNSMEDDICACLA